MKKDFLIKLPVIGYRIEIPEMLQAFLMIAVGLSQVPVLQEYLGMSYAQALTSVAIAEALGVLHVTFGDPVVPGWIASALSLILVYLGDYSGGVDTVHAMIALQLLVGLLFVVLGVTGLAHKLMDIVPIALKAGILLGAGIAALARVFSETGYLFKYPISIGVGVAITFIVLYSNRFKVLKGRFRFCSSLAKYGMLSGLVVAYILGVAFGELPVPEIRWGIIDFRFMEVVRDFSVFGIGFPPMSYFIKALPSAIAVYIVAFGEVVTAEAILQEAKEARPKDPIHFSTDETNLIAGVRNVLLALFTPFVAMAGPLWAAVSVSICERYKEGNAMKTIYGGMGTFKLFTALSVFFLPIACLCEPILPVALAITLAVQGFACSYIAFAQVKGDKVASGIAGVVGGIIYITGLNEGLIIGLLLCITMEINPFNLKKKEKTRAAKAAAEQTETPATDPPVTDSEK